MRKSIAILSLVAVIGLIWSQRPKQSEAPVPLAQTQVLPRLPSKVVSRPSVSTATVATTPVEEAEPLAAFGEWLNRFRAAPANSRSRLIEEGEKLARERQPAVYRLIAKDPAAALAAAVGESSRSLLPENILSLLERPVSAKTDLSVFEDDGDHHAAGHRDVFRQTQIEGKTYDAYVYGRRANQMTKYGTSLIGITLNDRMAVLEEPVRILSVADLPQAAQLETPVADSAHAHPAAASGPIVQAAGKYYPVCCAEHAHSIAARWVAAENRSGPIVQALGSSLPGLAPAAPAPASSPLVGAQTALVLLADFTDVLGAPKDTTLPQPYPTIDSAMIQQRLAVEVADFFSQASYGKTTIGTVTVSSLLHLPKTQAAYATPGTEGDQTALKNDVLAAAATAGYVANNYDRVMVIFADTRGTANNKFDWSGLAEIGGNFAWFNGNFRLGVVAHELGHNCGLYHAKLWEVANGSSPVDPAGSPLDYGDPFDIMGGAIGDAAVQPDPPNPWYLRNLGWLPDSAVQTVDTNTGTSIRLYRFDHKDASFTHPLALRINRGEGTDYWIGFRRKYHSYPTFGDAGEGAYIFWAKDGSPSSELIDIDTPGTNPNDAPLNAGQTFTDTDAGITIEVKPTIGGTSPAEYIDVQVTFLNRIAFEHKINNVDETAGTATLIVKRLNSSAGDVSVSYATSPGTALAGTNFTARSGTLTWTDGDTASKTITVPILVDAAATSTKTFTVQLTSVTGSPVFPSGATATVNIQKTGTEDSLFVHPFLTSRVNALALQPDGSVVIGGEFENTFAPITSSGIARLQPSGTLDIAFDQGPGASTAVVNAVARQPDGKLIVAGEFTSIRGVSRNRIARLLPSGGLDTSFDPGVGPGHSTASRNIVSTLAVQPDGKVLVGGKFLTWNGVSHKILVRLNSDGTLDSSFANLDGIVTLFAGNEEVNAIALQPITAAPHFAIVIGGLFYRPVAPNSHSGIIRLNADGTRDTSFFNSLAGAFSGNASSPVSSLAVQIDGKIVAGGAFTKFNGATANRIVRLSATGTNDNTFGTGLTSTQALVDVVALKIQSDGGILAGGSFERSAGVPQGVARFTAAGVRDTSFMPTINPWAGNSVTSMELAPDNTVLIALNDAGDNPLVVKRLFTGVGARAGIVQFASVATNVAEGSSAEVSVERVDGSSGKVSVNYQTISRSAVAGTNFTAVNGTLVWNDGDSTPQKILVPTTLNGATDPDLAFEINLGIPLGAVSIGQRAVSTVTIKDTPSIGTPAVTFASNSTNVTESNSTVTVTVNITAAHSDSIVVPFAVTGSAIAGATKDYTISASPLTFGNGVTSQDITISLKDDAVVDGNKTIVIDLQTPTSGTALLGAVTKHTINIADNEIAPAFTASPVNVTTAIGTPTVTFHSAVTGSPTPLRQWFKNKVKITTAATGQDYTLNNIQLTQAGSYSTTATNAFGAPSRTAELGVVDTTTRTVNVLVGGTATLSVVTAGNVLSYAWTKNGGNPVSAPRVTASAKSLIIKTANVATDAGVYICNVSNPGSAPVPVSFTLNVIDGPPGVTNTVKMDDAIVSGTYHYPITVKMDANLTPTSYSTSVLPSGLVCNPVTGIISGKPLVSGHFNITLKATNGRGTGTVTLPLDIAPMTLGTAGAYTGMIDRNATINANLGGKITLTVNPNGTYTGTLTLGATGYGINSALNTATTKTTADGDADATNASKVAVARVIFTINPSSGQITTGTITMTANSASMTFTAWHTVVPANTVTGYQTFSLKPDNSVPSSDDYPQGIGYGSFTVPTTVPTPSSTFPIAGVLADGTSFSSATALGPLGEVLMYQCLYTGTKGSILGKLIVSPGTQPAPLNTDSTTAGSITWNRPVITGRTYSSGFSPIIINANGGRIDVTKTTTMPPGFTEKANNASLSFTLAHVSEGVLVPASPNLIFTLKKGGVAPIPGLPNRTGFALIPSTGAFSGTFTQTTPARTGTYKGMLVNHGGTIQGDGYFTLPQALPTPTTSVILSGQVKLEATP